MPFFFFSEYSKRVSHQIVKHRNRDSYGDIIPESTDSDTTSIGDLTDAEIGTELENEYQNDVLLINRHARLEVERRNGVYTVSVSNCGFAWNKWENKPFSFTVVKRTHKERLAQAAFEADDEADD
jgi:hypothetical protein